MVCTNFLQHKQVVYTTNAVISFDYMQRNTTKMGKSAWAPYSNNQSKQVSEIDQKLHLFEYSTAQKHSLCQKQIFPSVLDYN